MMSSSNFDYTNLRASLLKLADEFTSKIAETWKADWSSFPPKPGYHFTYWDIKALSSYKAAIDNLAAVPKITNKYEIQSLERPIGAFLELTVAILPNPSFLDKAFEFWWKHFVLFLEAEAVPICLFIGLSNCKSARPHYRIDDETEIHFYNGSSLEKELSKSLSAPLPDPFPSSGIPLHLIPAAIQVTFDRPADKDTLQYNQYSHECIERMLPLEEALSLSLFGRLVTGPWIPICNPAFPIDGIRAIGFPEYRSQLYEPVVTLDDTAWDRFMRNYGHIRTLRSQEKSDIETDRAIRRRFMSAISRFIRTLDQGYWDSVVVDLVILMESLLTPNYQGGRMQLALAASNLLGTTPAEIREVFENIGRMYAIRNQSVHGDPSTRENWNAKLLEIAKSTGSSAVDIHDGVIEYTFEVMRDYARRTITYLLNLYYDTGRPPSTSLTTDLHRLHMDTNLRDFIHKEAHVYPIIDRLPPPK